jgi:uridine kinase
MFIIGIAGGSGSGKTTFARKIIDRASNPSVALLHQDSYYLPSPPSHIRVHGEPNFDHPDAFDWDLLREHLTALRAGKAIAVPVYDYHESRRTEETTLVGPCATVILEGIFALWDAKIRELFDLSIYLHVDSDIRFIRRLHRDVRERGRTLDGIIRQYYDTVRPMHHGYLEPTKQYADLVVGEESDIAADVVASRVIQVVRDLEA